MGRGTRRRRLYSLSRRGNFQPRYRSSFPKEHSRAWRQRRPRGTLSQLYGTRSGSQCVAGTVGAAQRVVLRIEGRRLDVHWHGAGCQNGKPGLALKIMAPTNSPAPDSADKPARSNLKTNLHAFGVSGVAFIVTLIGILHYWDRLIWPLMSPLVLAWLA